MQLMQHHVGHVVLAMNVVNRLYISQPLAANAAIVVHSTCQQMYIAPGMNTNRIDPHTYSFSDFVFAQHANM